MISVNFPVKNKCTHHLWDKMFLVPCSSCDSIIAGQSIGGKSDLWYGGRRGNPQLCLWLQTLAGGHRRRPHGDGQAGASSGAGVSDLRGRPCLSERAEHGGAAIPRQSDRPIINCRFYIRVSNWHCSHPGCIQKCLVNLFSAFTKTIFFCCYLHLCDNMRCAHFLY